MYEITTYDVYGGEIDTAESEDWRGCATQLWADSVEHRTGVYRAVVRDADGSLVRVFTDRPSR